MLEAPHGSILNIYLLGESDLHCGVICGRVRVANGSASEKRDNERCHADEYSYNSADRDDYCQSLI
jgi:hypothetical protein